jgi:DNA-binding NarL/FixJ family response regulator
MTKRRAKSVLLIEANPADALVIRTMFNHQGLYAFKLNIVASLENAMIHLASQAVDVVLLDVGAYGTRGQEVVRTIRMASPRVSIVLLSDLEDEAMALQAMQDGAQDYLVKGQMEPQELMRALRNAVERKTIEESLFSEKSGRRSRLTRSPML